MNKAENKKLSSYDSKKPKLFIHDKIGITRVYKTKTGTIYGTNKYLTHEAYLRELSARKN